jgi:hypothetical protein
MTNPTQQQLLAYKCRVLSQLADSLAPAQESAGTRKALHLIADELFDLSVEIAHLEPEAEEIPLSQILASFRRRAMLSQS